MADCTMEELLQAPTEGYGEAIVIPEILELTQIDTFYNGLTEQDHDSLNAASRGNLLNKTTREALQIIENKSKVRYLRSKSNVSRVNTNSRDVVSKTDDQIDKLADQISNLVEIVNKQVIAPAKENQPSTLSILSSITIPNPKGEMKAVTTRSGLAYEGPSIPTESSLEKVDEQNTEEILDKEHSNSSGSTTQVQHPVVPISIPVPDVLRTQSKPTIPYPSGLNDQKLQEKATNQMEKFFQIFHDLHFDISFADALLLMPKFASTIKSLLANKDKLFELAKVPLNEHYSAMLLKKLPEKHGDPVVDFEADPRVPLILGRSFLRTGRALIDAYGEEITLRYNPKSSSPTLVSDDSISESNASKVPIVKSSSPTLTPFGENPFQLPPMDLKVAEESKKKSSIEEPPELELKELPSHLEYAFLEDSNKLPVIIAKNLKVDEREALINVLKSHKRAISWKNFDIKGNDLRFYTHKILMKDDYKPAVQSQRRVNPKIYDVIKKEVIKLLDADMIYPISDSPWVSPIHYVPKKGGMTVVANKNNELILTRLVTGWRVRIDYRKLNDATRKYHFPLSFMDQMLERLAENEFYCFLDGFSGYFQIPIDPHDQEKTTFTCPYGTFTYRRMPFGLCNAPGTFQRCMMSIFHDMIEKMMVVFMDDFSVFVDSFSSCLTNLDKMLNRCEETNLVLNWEKCHFMCREGIVLGHKISKSGIEVDRAKVDVITKLPHPTTVKGVRSFLGHAGFYRRFIQIFKNCYTNDSSPRKRDTICLFQGEAFEILKACHEGPSGGHHGANLRAKRVMIKYEVTHLLATAYHPQTSGQVKVSNRGLKRILERTVGENRTSCLALQFSSQDFLWEAKTRWSGPFTFTRVFAYGTIELSQPNGPNFKVNGHRVKHYFGGDVPSNVAPDLHTFPMDN
nr:reverse transcriptase domain-containing protein [Tanacetum cinerariifolium]